MDGGWTDLCMDVDCLLLLAEFATFAVCVRVRSLVRFQVWACFRARIAQWYCAPFVKFSPFLAFSDIYASNGVDCRSQNRNPTPTEREPTDMPHPMPAPTLRTASIPVVHIQVYIYPNGVSTTRCCIDRSIDRPIDRPIQSVSQKNQSTRGEREHPPLHSSKNSTCTQKPHIKLIHIYSYSWDQRRRRHRQNPKKA